MSFFCFLSQYCHLSVFSSLLFFLLLFQFHDIFILSFWLLCSLFFVSFGCLFVFVVSVSFSNRFAKIMV